MSNLTIEFARYANHGRNVITSLLNSIPSIFSRVKVAETALLPALNAALSALQATGGKIIGATCTLPTFGPGALSLRDDPKAHGTDAERKLFTTENTAWRETAGKLAEAGVGVDMFIAAPSGTYMDVATIGRPPLYYCLASKLTSIRSCSRGHGRRNLLLPQLPRTPGYPQAFRGVCTCSNQRDGLSSAYEGPLLQRTASISVSRKLRATHIWR